MAFPDNRCIDRYYGKKAKGYQRGGREWEEEMAGLILEKHPQFLPETGSV